MSILGRIRDAIVKRDSVPRILTQGEAHPPQEWQGDLPLWGWDRAAIQAAAIAHDMGNFTQSERLYEAMTREGPRSHPTACSLLLARWLAVKPASTYTPGAVDGLRFSVSVG